MPITATPEDVKAVIMDLNSRETVDAILLERGQKVNMSVAVASGINYLAELIVREKDVDGERPKALSSHGLHSLLRESSALPSESLEGVLPCTVAGVLELMDHYHYSDNIQGANVVVIGRSRKLGKDSSIQTCHSKSYLKIILRLILPCITYTHPLQVYH
jgi:5,10-methylene-tetrahydrofolate dehydrogenase/methenyl tetrahydrofolate cyclohydrolase